MRLDVDFGLEHLDLEVPESGWIDVQRQPPAAPLADPAAAVRQALEEPLRFPALRRALTPDDHVAVVLSDRLPRLADLLTPLLEHVVAAHVAPENVTVVCATPACQEQGQGSLPGAFCDVRFEVHDPHDRRRLAYLATTRKGRRIYLNRTAVEADQIVVLSRRRYDPVLGYSGSEAALYPVLSDEPTRHEMLGRLSMAAPGEEPWPARREAAEVAWLLGAPFMVQIIEGAGDEIAHVVAGVADSSADGQRLLDARWRATVGRPADTVVATLGGDPGGHDFADLARAMACASRVVKPRGRIVVLSQATPELGEGATILRNAESPDGALEKLREQRPADAAAAFQWASAAQHASVYLLSGLEPETAEELFATPLEHAGQVQRLLNSRGSCVFLPDAHKMLAVTA